MMDVETKSFITEVMIRKNRLNIGINLRKSVKNESVKSQVQKYEREVKLLEELLKFYQQEY